MASLAEPEVDPESDETVAIIEQGEVNQKQLIFLTKKTHLKRPGNAIVEWLLNQLYAITGPHRCRHRRKVDVIVRK